jgi:hypothetical protein
MKPHVRAQTLARFREGDLGPRRSARISAHLARCARCQARSEDLAGVTRLLASVHPPPIPEHLAARIHTALTTEAARRVTLPEENAAAPAASPAGTGPAADGRHPRRERPAHGRRPRVPRLRPAIALAAAAAVVVVAGGIYEIAQNSASSSSAGSPAAAPAVSGAGEQSRAAASAPAAGPVLTYRHADGEASVTAVMTGTDFAPGRLSVQVATQLARHGPGSARVAGPNATAPPATQGPATAGRQPATFGHMAVADLAGCVNRIAAGDLVLLVDVARYQGGPATVIVTQPSAGGPEQIWVVGPGCSASRSDVLRHAALSPAG